MKKFLKLFSAMVLGVCVLMSTVFSRTVYANTVNPVDLHYVQGRMYYTDLASKGINVSYATNLEELLSGDNTVYNQDLAITAEILASDIYDNVRVNANGDTSTDVSDNTSIYSRDFGMDDVQIFDLGTMGYTEDVNDISRFAISHKKISENGTEKEIIVVAVEGTNGTYSQWSSNYDVGGDEDVYPGQHSEWLDHENHKGFDVTFRRVLGVVNTYISQSVSSTAEKSILITGHSRGGAIANLLGKYFEEDPGYKSFTYTFASPTVTTKADTSASTIFNIINTDDAIPYFPTSTWGFKRYGTDVNYNVAELTTQWNNLTGLTYKVCTGSTIRDRAGAMASNRSELYVLNKEIAVSSDECASEEDAKAKIAEKKETLNSLGFSEDCYTFEVTENIKPESTTYTVSGYIGPAFIMEYLARLASISNPYSYMIPVVQTMNYSKINNYSLAASFMMGHYIDSSIVHAHCTYTYYFAAMGGVESGTTPITGTVSISGNAISTQILTADYNDGNAGNTIIYQWIRVDSEGNETEISGATAKKYTITDDDIGCTLKVTITGVGVYTGSLTSSPTEKVEPFIPVSLVTLDSTSLTLNVGDSSSLTATISPKNATNKNISWSSDNPSVASVDENGKVTALTAGKTTVKVTSENGNLSAECTVTVNPVKYKVNFDTNGHGTSVDSQNVVSGEKASKPVNPTEKGYTFKGWYKEATCKNAWDFDKDTVTDNITLYAKWEKESSDSADKNSRSSSKTGYESFAWQWMLLATVSAGSIASLILFRKKKNS